MDRRPANRRRLPRCPAASWSRTGLLDGEDNGRAMRIVSLQPSATEIVFALGLGEWLVGRSHRCDHPEEVVDVPVVTSAGPMKGSPAFGADDGRVDLKLLATLEPDLVLTAAGCGAAFEAQAVRDGLRARGLETSVVGLDPRSLEGIFNSISTVGAFVEAEDEAIGLVELLREQLGRLENGVLERRLEGIASRRTIILESLDPPVGAGLWVPELVRRAGGWELLGREGEDPETTSWERVREVEPEVLVLALRGCDAPAAARLLQSDLLADLVRRAGGCPRWSLLRGRWPGPDPSSWSAHHRGHRRAGGAPRPRGLQRSGLGRAPGSRSGRCASVRTDAAGSPRHSPARSRHLYSRACH